MVSKKVNKNGSITLPKQLRTESGLFAGNAVDIEQRGEEIIVKKHVQTCHFCGSVNGVKNVMGIDICRDCAAKIHQKVVCGNE